MFRKNDFVAHPAKPEWGVGIVVADQQNDDVSVFFENEPKIMTFRLSNLRLDEIAEPGDSRTFLENILISDASGSAPDREPFPSKVAKFVAQFSGALHGPVLEKYEREYKQLAHEQFVATLDQPEYQQLIESKKWSELGEAIKKCHGINLLSKFELIQFSDVLKNPNAQKDVGQGLYDFLYGTDPISTRFHRYTTLLRDYECDKWPLVTLPLFLRFPDKFMFVKPTMTKEAAANRGFDIQYESRPNWDTYHRVLLFSQDLFTRLLADKNPQLHPRDMIDVQTFMWCTFTKGWSASEIEEAEKELDEAS